LIGNSSLVKKGKDFCVKRRMRWTGCLLMALGFAAPLTAQNAELDGPGFFDTRVQPVLCSHCILCHNDRLNNGNLSFEHRESLLHGGDLGAAVVPFKPEQSVLIHAVRRDGRVSVMMPPGPPLSDADVATLTEWVKRGAPWGTGKACKEREISIGPGKPEK
jgi:Planctomycete cytochrome C